LTIIQGLNLLGLAIEESASLSREATGGNASFSRQLYLHAVTYLLRGLPEDLTTEEQMSVRGALPQGIVTPLRVESSDGHHLNYSQIGRDRSNPSLLHKTLASTIVQLFILFQFILPYVKILLASAYQYERTHRISEKILARSMDTVDGIGKRGLTITAAIYGIGDGKVGQALNEVISWVVKGVTGGIHDGVGEGMIIMGAKKSSVTVHTSNSDLHQGYSR
jgi:hypothetical protein